MGSANGDSNITDDFPQGIAAATDQADTLGLFTGHHFVFGPENPQTTVGGTHVEGQPPVPDEVSINIGEEPPAPVIRAMGVPECDKAGHLNAWNAGANFVGTHCTGGD